MHINFTSDIAKEGPKILIMGESGVGKTFCASSLPNLDRTLFINVENGTKTLQDFNIPVINVTKNDHGSSLSWQQRLNRLREVMTYLSKEETRQKFDYVFFDSLTEIGEIFFHTLQEKYPDRNKTMILYGELAQNIEKFIKMVRDLPHYTVVLSALLKSQIDDSQRVKYFCNLKGAIAQVVGKYFDEVYTLRVFKKDNSIVRAFQTEPIDGFEGKSRSGKLNTYEEANLTYILNKINPKEEEC